MDKLSFLSNANISTIEDLYQKYIKGDNPENGWGKFFEGFEFARKHYDSRQDEVPDSFRKEFKVINLINGYRQRGHLFTKTNPVRKRRQYAPTLDIENFGLEEGDLDIVFQAGSELGTGPTTLREIIAHLKQTYCLSVGVEYTYIRQPEVFNWLGKRMETTKNTPAFSVEQKKHILQKINQAVAFEQFLHIKFVGQKRFSLEGCETFIPALDAVIEKGAELGIEEFVLGMAHRGRLNVLTNIFNKSYEDVFSEFEGSAYDELSFGGDVKYHLGFSSDIKTKSGKQVHLSLAANPSHLESVGPVVEGVSRAKIDFKYNNDYNKLVPVIVHGDASIAGQGVVYEVTQMSQLAGYKTGGTVHIVINNQIGFTTNYIDARSSTYCTDVAKVTLSPVFHVNADDVEAVVFAVQMAMEFRQEFHRDVFIDMLGYRKHGHNEGDEPKFTQPLLYKAIAMQPNPSDIYKRKLTEKNEITQEFITEMEKEFNNILQQKLDFAKAKKDKIIKVEKELHGPWKEKRFAAVEDFKTSPDTGVAKKIISELGSKMLELPTDKNFFRKIHKLFDERKNMLKDGKADWAVGELLAYATLLNEGHAVRISGQDVQRGTFSHRHAVVTTEDTAESYVPLKHLSKNQGNFEIYNSLLSEFGVLGFEYGYASISPDRLVIWEAQFGDFSNESQVISDQYISVAEDRWLRQNGLVMLLPHGYEGQGAEHSSARIERYLQLCAKLNLQVVNCSTPANFFHVLRRQVKRDFCKPLIAMTPKSLLRHPRCISPLEDFTKGGFREVIDDTAATVNEVNKVAFCSGKIYYELLEKKEKHNIKNIAVVRIEQLYPLADEQLSAIIKKYKNAKKFIWVQEEPENMGAWAHLFQHFKEVPLDLIARPKSATPATGSGKIHIIEQVEIHEKLFEKSFHKDKVIKGYITHFAGS